VLLDMLLNPPGPGETVNIPIPEAPGGSVVDWFEKLVTQDWFPTALLCLVVASVFLKMWRSRAGLIVILLVVFAALVTAAD
jgi:hypothetical protein